MSLCVKNITAIKESSSSTPLGTLNVILRNMDEIYTLHDNLKEIHTQYIDVLEPQDYKDIKKIIDSMQQLKNDTYRSNTHANLESTRRIIESMTSGILKKYICD